VKVLLVSVNRSGFPYPVYPLGLDHVAGAISPPHEVRILDLCPVPEDRIAAEIDLAVRGFAPDAVGVSIRNIDNNDATAVEAFLAPVRGAVDRIRAATRAPIVLGGSGFTLFPDALLAFLGADYGIVGEGEQALALLDALEQGRSPEGLPGVALPGRPAPRAIPLAGVTPRRCAPGTNPALPFYRSRGGILNLQTQRGCVYRCIYCTYPGIEGRLSRGFAPDDVARTARELEGAGARFLFLTDSVFNGDPAHAERVADAFRRAGLGVPWGAYFAPTRPPDGFYARMAAARCSHVEFGTEALSDRMLARIRKTFRKEDVLAAHRAALAAGLHVAHFLLLGGPGETEETLEETLSAAEQLDGAALFFFCGMRIYPGTELAAIAEREGQIPPGQSLLEPVFYEPPGLPLEEIARRVERRADGRTSWLVGDGADRAAALVERLHARGHPGPLWERLVA
jgi:radical SAM superfamily enzyme YgiQ (UPF0313 family)